MAQLFSRGTLTRTRWDYFERTNGWAFVTGHVTSGGIGTYFTNNSTATMHLDIYNLTWAASVAMDWDIWLYSPPLTIIPLAPDEASVNCIQPDMAAPAGIVGMYSGSAGSFRHIQRISNSVNGGIVTPVGGMAWLTLPPLFSIAVSGNPGSNPSELSMSVWYQETLDNIAQAR